MDRTETLENLLQVFIITCSRSARLATTLQQLQQSPFAKCRITVLDNCSWDDTASVIASFAGEFPDFHVVRHNRNIGGDGNYLRAIEMSTGRYTWVLCDDDTFDFSAAHEVISAIERRASDLIYVGPRSDVHLRWSGSGETSARKLIAAGAAYHRACTFWPALIFRTELFIDKFLHNAPYMFPGMGFINRSVNEDFSIFVPSRQIVIRYEGSMPESSPLLLYREWVTNIARVADRKIKDRVIEQWTEHGMMRTLGFWIAMDRSRRMPGLLKCYVDILFAVSPRQRMKLLLLSPLLFIPLPLGMMLSARRGVYRLMGRNPDELPPVECVGR